MKTQSYGITVDDAGNAYVVGSTWWGGLFIPVNLFQAEPAGGQEGYIVKLDPNGVILYATLIGGLGDDNLYDIALDSEGDMYICGSSGNAGVFPGTANGWDNSHGSGTDGLVFKMKADFSEVMYATYLGGDGGTDIAWEIAVDSGKNVCVTGMATAGKTRCRTSSIQARPNVLHRFDGIQE